MHVLVVLLVLEVSRVDKVSDPFCLVVVLFASSDLAAMPCLHVLSFLSPTVNLDIAVQKRVIHCHHTEFRITYGPINVAWATEEDSLRAVTFSRFAWSFYHHCHFSGDLLNSPLPLLLLVLAIDKANQYANTDASNDPENACCVPFNRTSMHIFVVIVGVRVAFSVMAAIIAIIVMMFVMMGFTLISVHSAPAPSLVVSVIIRR